MSQFARDVREGLSSKPKRLSSKYFYDTRGDEIFQQIMQMDEYYLSRAELGIFKQHKQSILELIDPGTAFRLVELGAGDGTKTKILLDHFVNQQADFIYCPIDISANVLKQLQRSMLADIPQLKIEPMAGDYFKMLGELKFKNHFKTIVFFLGSNIGNYQKEMAIEFLTGIHDNLQKGDLLMIGFDLKKDPKIILNAYNDPNGITKAFNLNLLERINRELGGDFDTSQFDHNPIYDPATGQCRSYLISKRSMKVRIEALDMVVDFKPWEPIFMEVSKKYDLEEIDELAELTGFRVLENFFDTDRLFTDSVWEVI